MVKEKGILEPEIIFEDEDFLIINKPAGLIVHSDGKSDERTLCDWLIEKFPEMKGVGEPLKLTDGRVIERPGIVPRIDRWTSGILLIAKNNEVHQFFKKQFQNREIKKIYFAFVYGNLKEKFGTINAPLGRSKGDFRQYTTPARSRGEMREAITYFEVEREGKGASYLKVSPKTGRTHQIRAHMISIGHPIVCDRVYSKRECILGFNRMALHAYSLEFETHGKKRRVFEAPLPDDFKEGLKIIAEAD